MKNEKNLLTFLMVVITTLTFGQEESPATQKRGWLGVIPEKMSPAVLAALGIDYGVLIAEVIENSPAAKAGLKMGDAIISLDDEKITDSGDLIQAVRLRPNKKVEMVILRQLKKQRVTVEIGERNTSDIESELDRKQMPQEGIRKLREALRQLKPLFRFERKVYKEYLDSLRCQIEELQQELKELKRKVEEEKR